MSSLDLVTGADGFVGRHLVRHLVANGRAVRTLDQRGHGSLTGDAVIGDLGDPTVRRQAFAPVDGQGVDTVYHLAACHLAVQVAEREVRRVNVSATADLAHDAAAAGVRRFVHFSTVGVYGRLDSPPADETTPCRPRFAYERTKLDGEAAVLEIHRQHALPVVVLRPAWIYGPGCPRTEALFRAIARRRFVCAGDGSKWRHGIFIDDLLDATDRAATAEAAVGQVILVADRTAAPVATWLRTIARRVGTPPPPRLPLPLFELAAFTIEGLFKVLGRQPPVSRRTSRFFTANTAFDTARARRLLGFEPRFDVASGLAETAHRLGYPAPGSP